MLNKCYFSRFKNFEGLKQTNHLLRHIQTNNLFAVNIFFSSKQIVLSVYKHNFALTIIEKLHKKIKTEVKQPLQIESILPHPIVKMTFTFLFLILYD